MVALLRAEPWPDNGNIADGGSLFRLGMWMKVVKVWGDPYVLLHRWALAGTYVSRNRTY
jgi:hypothetical protein